MDVQHFEQGTFFIGCNYWASHAGTFMWNDWDEQTVEDDLHRLSEARIHTLRIFPLWSDFQPLKMHMGAIGKSREERLGEKPLGFDEVERAGVDRVMLQRFGRFCDLAEKHRLKLIVGLLTGWMSGRLFVPKMLQGVNLLTDPIALKWEIRFIRLMVRCFRDYPTIVAWDLGNECNCLGHVEHTEQAYVWASTIAMAIRCEDRTRPILSGMHSLLPDGQWRMQDQADFLDVFCTHPYPIFTPHCDTDPLNQMKSALHAAAESRLYADLSGKPCFAEEMGVLGPMVISDEYAADYIRASLLTLLAHDCRGMLWWCGFEQSDLTHTPYDWNGVERELGLFYLNKTEKPVVKTMTAFSKFVEKLPFARLPQCITDAVCILTRGQDVWAAAYGAFILAKQAHVDLTFAWADGPIPEASTYLVPSMFGDTPMNRSVQQMLMERVRQGARLYLSLDGALLSPFSEFSGIRVLTRAHAPESVDVHFAGKTIRMNREYRLRCETIGAQVLACTGDGEIAFTRNGYGNGEVFTLLFPLEKEMACRPGMTDSNDAQPGYVFYEAMNLCNEKRVARINLPTVGLTEHILEEEKHAVIVVNYEPYAQEIALGLNEDWTASLYSSMDDTVQLRGGTLHLSNNNGAVFLLEKTR